MHLKRSFVIRVKSIIFQKMKKQRQKNNLNGQSTFWLPSDHVLSGRLKNTKQVRSRLKLEFGNVGRRKPEKNLLKHREPTTNSNHIWRQNARQNVVFVACIGGVIKELFNW